MSQRRQTRPLEAVVIHLRDYDESHRIVEILSREAGRVSTLARGARRSKKRFMGILDLFVSLRAHVIEGSGLWTLHAADVIDLRLPLRSALERIGRASLLLECARVLSVAEQEAEAMHDALVAGLDACSRGELAAAAAAYPRLLLAAGILPDFGRCTQCGRPQPEIAAIDGVAGGIRCVACAPGYAPIPRAATQVLRGESCEADDTADRVEAIATRLVEEQIGRALRSRSVWSGER